MHIETGQYDSAMFSKLQGYHYTARVIISSMEFVRLECRWFAGQPSPDTPLIGYLYAEIGRCGIDWNVDSFPLDTSSAWGAWWVYFRRYEDALLFLLRWSA
jgi:hypothetical protein